MTPTIIIFIIFGYFALLLGVSKIVSRNSANSTFFTGDRQLPWGIVAFATLGAAISGVTFISVPGMVVTKGYSYLQMVIGFTVGYIVISAILLPLFYKRNLVSIYGYLNQRFGRPVYKTGASFFFISKLLGAGVRFYVVCAVLQLLVFTPLDIPFAVNVCITVALIWLYTVSAGVKAVIFTDLIKSTCLIGAVVLSIIFIAGELNLGFTETFNSVVTHPSTRVFFFDNPMEANYFWKQFIAGVFMVIAMNGLDQDMMQRHMACPDWRASRKNMLTGAVLQAGVIALFLVLGTMLLIYVENSSMDIPANTDELFGSIATSSNMPLILGIVFVVGLISAAYSAAASALTSLTTSFTLDILEADINTTDQQSLKRTRQRVHLLMSVALAVVIIAFYYINSEDAISAVYILASYTYGPLLGLFAFGLMSKSRPSSLGASAACVLAPLLSYFTSEILLSFGYHTGFELLLINAGFTMIGLAFCSAVKSTEVNPLIPQDNA